METVALEHWQLVIWLMSVAALGGQSWANTRILKSRQDTTNAHLTLLNDKTFTSHREIGQVMGAIESLPCRTGQVRVCPVLTQEGVTLP